MSKKDDGGPAYPVTGLFMGEQLTPASPADQECAGYGGMTLRDYFAGQALAGILADPNAFEAFAVDEYYSAAADYAFRMADAMLAVRSEQ